MIKTWVGVEEFLGQIRDSLKSGGFRPVEVRQVTIPKGMSERIRKLGIPTVADRVVQASLKAVLEPIFEADFKRCWYRFRPTGARRTRSPRSTTTGPAVRGYWNVTSEPALMSYDDKPTYLYMYEQAVKDDYLVDYTFICRRALVSSRGDQAANLTEEERNLLIQHELNPDEINYEGTELEERVTVKDMLRRQWQEIMDVCHKNPSGMPCKTIVFAMTKKHALRIGKHFYEVFPQYVDMAKVVISEGDYRSKNFAFKKENKPRIAISVDMLDTGVDVPEVIEFGLYETSPVTHQVTANDRQRT